ncbi:MARVEL domain-containing protein 3 [Osmerus eperlanus]|uniref:MARVEL domain-containing protein 3 n=1 Tax=Osmerus eperlanus TaxID=29151 RepID=UPI002E0FFD0E
MSQSPRTNRGQRERERERNGGGHREHREDRPRREPRNDRPPSSGRSSSQPSTPPSKHHRQHRAPQEREDSKCNHICSRRGIVLIVTILTNALVLVCVVAAQMVMSGMSAMGGMTTFDINSAYSPFEGTELQKVRDLDMQFSQMRAPGIYGGVAFSLVFGVTSLLFVVSGNKPAYELSRKLLIGGLAFQALGAVAYVVAVGLYLHFVIAVNATDVCRQRERLYAGRGYTWMNCDVGGADAAVALFGLITAILYGVGAVLSFSVVRAVWAYHRDGRRHEAERRAAPAFPQRAPLRTEATAV